MQSEAATGGRSYWSCEVLEVALRAGFDGAVLLVSLLCGGLVMISVAIYSRRARKRLPQEAGLTPIAEAIIWSGRKYDFGSRVAVYDDFVVCRHGLASDHYIPYRSIRRIGIAKDSLFGILASGQMCVEYMGDDANHHLADIGFGNAGIEGKRTLEALIERAKTAGVRIDIS